MRREIFLQKTIMCLMLIIIGMIVLHYSVKSLHRNDMCSDMAEKVKEYLDDVSVYVLGEKDDCYYFIVDSSNLEQLSEDELRGLYEEVDLERRKVAFYTVDEKKYYLLPNEDHSKVSLILENESRK